MKYAVIKTGGKQYRVSEGEEIEVEFLNIEPKNSVSFEEVLLYVDQGTIRVGDPRVSGVFVKASVLEKKKGDKIRVSRFLAKSRHRRVVGHRQILSRVKIEQILDSQSKKKEKIEASTVVKQPKKPRKLNSK